MIRRRVSASQAGDAPVVDDVVDVLNRSLGLWVAALVVDPQVAGDGDIGDGIDEGAEALRVDRFADDAVLYGHVVRALRDAHAIPAAPLDRAVVEDDVARAGHVDRAFTLVAVDAFSHTQVTNDDVVGSTERKRAVVQANALARRGLAGDGDVAGARDVRFELDHAADVEDDDAI